MMMNKFEGSKERWEGVQVRLLCSKLDGESRTEQIWGVGGIGPECRKRKRSLGRGKERRWQGLALRKGTLNIKRRGACSSRTMACVPLEKQSKRVEEKIEKGWESRIRQATVIQQFAKWVPDFTVGVRPPDS